MNQGGNGDSYDDLIEHSIDTLNEERDFSGTKLDSARKPKAKRRSLFESPALLLLTLLAALSSAWLAYERLSASEPEISLGEANAQIQESINDLPKKELRDAAQTMLRALSAPPEDAVRQAQGERLADVLKSAGVQPGHAAKVSSAVSSRESL